MSAMSGLVEKEKTPGPIWGQLVHGPKNAKTFGSFATQMGVICELTMNAIFKTTPDVNKAGVISWRVHLLV